MADEQAIDVGIRMEQSAIEFYGASALKVQDPLAKRMLESFVQDERGHLEKMLAAKEKETFSTDGISEEAAILLRAKNAFEEIPDEVKGALESDPSDRDVIAAAITMEQEGQSFYIDAAASVKSDAERELFRWLVGEEAQHIKVLQNTASYLNNPGDWFMGEEHWIFDGG